MAPEDPAEPARPDRSPPPSAADVPVRDAATVILLREEAGEPEVFLFRRASRLVFAGGMYAFPGGAVEPQDADAGIPWLGGDTGFAGPLGATEPQARALTVAAVRETFEECGLLLAAGGTAPPEDLTAERAAVIAGERTIGDVLAGHGLAVNAAALTPWAHWVTPPGQPRRFDTRFFLAAPPAGQEPRFLGGEAQWAGWMPVAEAVRGFEAEQLAMLPPTISCLRRIAEARAALPGLAEVLASRPEIVRVSLDRLPPGVRT